MTEEGSPPYGVVIEPADGQSTLAGSSSAVTTPILDNISEKERFLRRIKWKNIIPTTSFLSALDSSPEELGDLKLFSSVAYKEYVVCVGGTSLTHGPFRGYRFIPTLHVVDSLKSKCCCCCGVWVSTATWKYREAKGDIPPQRHGQQVALINNTLFMFGGRATETERLLNDLHALDLESMIWTRLTPNGDIPSPRIRHTLTYVDGFLYLLGGVGANYSAFVKDCFWRYDIKSGAWDLLPPPPTTDEVIAGHTASALESQAVVVFGGTSSILGREANLLQFDTAGGRWSRIPTDKQISNAHALEDHAVVTFEKDSVAYFVFHGGLSIATTPNQLLILRYHNGVFRWFTPNVRKPKWYPPPVELSKHSIVCIKDVLLFLGGTMQYSRESEMTSSCCGYLSSYGPSSSSTKVPVVYLSKKVVATCCCSIM